MKIEIEERRNLTILFADLSGFTRLSSKLDPEDVREVVSTCFEFFNKPIVYEGGSIHKYEGDSVIALFGFPVAHEDDPERAIRASLAMINLIPEVNRALSTKLKKETDVGLHVGINMGTVVVGKIGSKEKREYTIMGDVVNITSRLKDIAEEGEIIVSETIFRASRYLFDYKICPSVPVKGIDEEIKIFKPLKVKEEPEPKRGIKGLTSPMIGRDKEFASIRKKLEELNKGKGSVLFILGEAGIGKSRLLDEVKKLIKNKSFAFTLFEGRCLSYGETLPYWPFLQILKEIFKLSDSDSKDIIQKKLKRRTKEIIPDKFEELLPYLGYLFSIRFPGKRDEKIKHLDAQALRLQIFVSIKKLLTSLSQKQPLLIILEDYHWIDNESLLFLKFLFNAIEEYPILFICLSRIEKGKEPFKIKEEIKNILGSNYQEIRLTPLNSESSNELIFNLLSVPNIPQPLKDKILAKAEGNPFYVEEVIRALIDSGMLKYSSGMWRLTKLAASSKHSAVPDLKIPDSVQGVIRARLDKLEPDVKDSLEKAAIIGRSFTAPILERLCGIDNLLLTMNLAILEDYEYISEFEKKPELEYIFRHPMLHEVTYNSILKKRRREMHGRAAEIIEDEYNDRLEDFTDILAHQYAKSDNTEKAIEWLWKAGNKARERFANDEAISNFRKLLQIAEDDIEKNREKICDSYEILGGIYIMKGDNESALECSETMYRYAGDDTLNRSGAKRLIAGIYERLGKWDDALLLLDEIEVTLSDISYREIIEKFEIYNLRSLIYKLKGDLDRALESSETALEFLNSKQLKDSKEVPLDNIKWRKASGLSSKAAVYYTKGEFIKAIELWEESLKTAEGISERRGINSIFNNLGVAYYSIGNLKKALEIYEQGLKVSEEIGEIQVIARTSSNLAVTYYIRGEYKKANELFRKCLLITEDIGDKIGTSVISGNLGVSYYNSGDIELANQFFLKGLSIAKAVGYKQGIGRAMIKLVRIHNDRGEYDKALKKCKKAIRIAKELDKRHTLGTRYYDLGNIYLLKKDFKKAGKYLTESEVILNETEKELEDRQEIIENAIVLADLKCKFSQISKNKIKNDSLNDVVNYLEKGIKLAKKLGSKFSEAKCYIVYAKLTILLSEIKKSEDYFRKGTKILKKLKQRKMLADSYCEYAQILKEKTDRKGLITQYYKKAEKLYKDMRLTHKIDECKIRKNNH